MKLHILILLLTVLQTALTASAAKRSTVPDWYDNAISDPDQWVGISPASPNPNYREEAALSSAILQWFLNGGKYKFAAHGEATTQEIGTDYNHTAKSFEAGKLEGDFSVIITKRFTNEANEHFVTCRIVENTGKSGSITYSRESTINENADNALLTVPFNIFCHVSDKSNQRNIPKYKSIDGIFIVSHTPDGNTMELEANTIKSAKKGAGMSLFEAITAFPLTSNGVSVMTTSNEDRTHTESITNIYTVFQLRGEAHPIKIRAGKITRNGLSFSIDQTELMKKLDAAFNKASADERFGIASSTSSPEKAWPTGLRLTNCFINALPTLSQTTNIQGRIISESEPVQNKTIDDFINDYSTRITSDDFQVIWHIGDQSVPLPEELVPEGFDYNCGITVMNLPASQEDRMAKLQKALADNKPQVDLSSFIEDEPATSSAQPMAESNTIALVIANENYDEVANVESAANDGASMKRFLTQTLGLPERNIYYYPDATFGKMTQALDKLSKAAKVYSNDSINVIFYYAGHGIPDERTSAAYLLPVDASPHSTAACLGIDKLYEVLGSIDAKTVTVFIDACFSGSERSGNMLVSARGVQIKPKMNSPKGNMVVFTACSGNETAHNLAEENHGIFTYHLLKKLGETKGKIKLGELADYLSRHVSRTAFERLDKVQIPSISISPSISSTWRDLPLVR